MSISEDSMRFLEEHIPILADAAIKQAYWQALASGSSVLVCELMFCWKHSLMAAAK